MVQSISYLSHQCIALHNGKQNNESNIKQLLLLRAEDDEVLQKWIEKTYDKYMARMLRIKYYKSCL